jgi:hypothetical protein
MAGTTGLEPAASAVTVHLGVLDGKGRMRTRLRIRLMLQEFNLPLGRIGGERDGGSCRG